MFKVGQKVVCVNDVFDPIQQATIPVLPKREKTYTVRDAFQVTRNGTTSGVWALHLKEISNPMLPHPSGLGTFEPSFAADRFAELNDDQQIEEREVEQLLRELEKVEELEMV